MLPQLLNMLTWWQWLIVGAVPSAVIALYFLKLKRRPLEVPSTYLWHRSIEDLHVNTIWQRLRRNLLLFLQLLLLLLAALALLRPYWRGTELPGNRFIFLIDNSASMQATDVEPSRLDEAKRQARELIKQMEPGDAAMIVSFADSSGVEEMFTENQRQLDRSLMAIRPTARGTSLVEALKVAAGLANPGHVYDARDLQVAEPLPATVYIISDGRFPPISDFPLGNLTPIYTPIGSDRANNVGIVAFSVKRHESRPTELQAFARLENFGSAEITVELELSIDGRMIDADEVSVAGGEARGVIFDLGDVESGVLSLRATTGDDLAVDDEAWTVVNPPRRAEVLLVTTGNEPLELALETEAAMELADVTLKTPDFLEKEKEYQEPADVGAFDLVIYDRCSPKKMPQANTLFIGSLPPGDVWKAEPKGGVPQIIDVDLAHPLMHWLDLGDVFLADGTPLAPPPGGSVLIDSHLGPMLAVAPRDRFEDAVMGFVLVDQETGDDGKTQTFLGTDWPKRGSFPSFVFNVLHYLGGGWTSAGSSVVQPGQPVMLQSPRPDKPLEVRRLPNHLDPDGEDFKLKAQTPGKFGFTATGRLGAYEVSCDDKVLEHFAVNLFQPSESDIRPSPEVNVGALPVKGQASGWEATRREIWKILLLVGLAVLCLEWYIFNRRVYV